MDGAEGAQSWPTEIHRVLKAAEVRQMAYVPDAGHLGMLENPAAVQPMMETHWNAHGSQAEPAPALTG